MKIELQKLTLDDAEHWLELQKEAYQSYLEKYQDYEISPAAETIETVMNRMNVSFRDHFFIIADSEIVGGIRTAWWEGTARYRLGGIFILPKHQNSGIGQTAIRMAEALYPDAESWDLYTIAQEPRLIHLYEKLGYRRENEEQVINDKMTLVYYRKPVN